MNNDVIDSEIFSVETGRICGYLEFVREESALLIIDHRLIPQQSTYICACGHVHMYVHIYICIYMRVCVYLRVYIYIHNHKYTYI